MVRKQKRWRMERRIVEYLLLGKSANAIAAELRVCKKTVKRVRSAAEELGYLDGTKALPVYPEPVFPPAEEHEEPISEVDSSLQEHRAWIIDRLETGWHPITVWEELPVKVSRASFYRFLRRHKLGRRSAARVVPEIVHKAGEALQLDWGKLTTAIIDGRRRKVWVLLGVLGYSRYRMARVMLRCDLATTLSAIRSMLEQAGGVPLRLTTDNPKVFSLIADMYEPLLHPAFERFTAHYGTIAECLPPRAPQLKGKVERQVPYARRLWEAHGEWVSLEEAQSYLDRKLFLANACRHGSTRKVPAVELHTERAAFKSLPALPFEIEEYHSGTVRRDGHVRFRAKYYSVDEQHLGAEVAVIGSPTKVTIYRQGNLLEVHDRIPADSPIMKSTKPQHLKPWERALHDDSLYSQRARALGPAVEELVRTIIGHGQGFIDYRRVWGILSLDKKYPREKIDEACQIALSLHKYSYRYVAALLATPQMMQVPSSPEPETKPGKFVRSPDEYKRHIALTLIRGGKTNELSNASPATGSTEAAHRGSRA